MTAAKKLYDALVAEYSDGIVSITDLSKPDEAGKYFIESSYVGLNFDLVKNFGGNNSFKEMSPDAFFLKNNEIYFVEFKSGGFDKKDLRSKINEGLNTLFQFSVSRGILSRDDFLDIPINYVVIATQKGATGKPPSFANALKLGSGYFGLRNMEGFLVKKTSLLTKPDVIYEKFRDITNNEIGKMIIHCPVDGARTFGEPVI